MALRTLSCFTGGYGLDLGIELAFPGAFEPVLYVEIDVQVAGFLAALQKEGFVPEAPIWSDIRTVCDAKVRAFLRQRAGTRTVRGAVQAVVAGYPCPDFSTAGKRKGLAGEKGRLWFALADCLRLYRPDVAFLENVGGHLRRGFDRVVSDLRGMGYEVAAGLFTAEEVGDTQKRERLFVLAVREGWRGEGLVLPAGQGDEGQGTGLADGRGSEVADYQVANRRQNGEGAKAEARQRRGQPSGGNREVARRSCESEREPNYPARSQPQQPRGHARKGSGRRGRRLARVPLFPPGPDSLAAWEDVLARRIEYAPAVGKATQPHVRRLAHGLARVDALRLYGNGVVPLQAAYAFSTLRAATIRKQKGRTNRRRGAMALLKAWTSRKG